MTADKILIIIGQIIALATGIGGIILALLTARKTEAEREKIRADAASTIVDSSIVLLKPLNEKILELESNDFKREAEIAKLRIENNKLKKAICCLIKQLKANKLTPDWTEIDCLHLEEI